MPRTGLTAEEIKGRAVEVTAFLIRDVGFEKRLFDVARRLVIAILITVPTALTAGPDGSFARIDDLMRRGQCASALSQITGLDPELKDPAIVRRLLDLSLNCSVTLPEAGDRFGFVDRKEGEAASAHLPQGVVSFAWPVHATLERLDASIASDAVFTGLAADYYSLVCASKESWPDLNRSMACAKADRLYTRLLREEAKPQSCVRYLSFLKSATPEYSRREEPQLRQCLKEWPADADLLLYDALYQYRLRHPKEAISQAMRSAEKNKDRKRAAQALSFAASVAFETEDYARSAELYRKAVTYDATNPRYLEGQITALLFADNTARAAKELQEAMKRHREIPPVAIDLIRRAYADLDRHDAFVSAVTPLAEDAKLDLLKRVLLYRSISLAQIELGKRVEARLALEKGIHLTEKLNDDRRESLLVELRRILRTIESK